MNVFNKYIVANGAIVQAAVVQSAVFETAVHFEDFVKFPQFDCTRKMHVGYILWCKIRVDCYVAPVIGYLVKEEGKGYEIIGELYRVRKDELEKLDQFEEKSLKKRLKLIEIFKESSYLFKNSNR